MSHSHAPSSLSSLISFATPSPLSIDTSDEITTPTDSYNTHNTALNPTESGPSSSRSSSDTFENDLFGSPFPTRGNSLNSTSPSTEYGSSLANWDSPSHSIKDSFIISSPGNPGPLELDLLASPNTSPSPRPRLTPTMSNSRSSFEVDGGSRLPGGEEEVAQAELVTRATIVPPPTKSFDPFLPFSTSSTSSTPAAFAPPPRISPPTITSTAPPRPYNDSSPNPALPSASGSIVRDNRPTSLYIPMDDGSSNGTGSGQTPTWPFNPERRGSSAEDLLFAPLPTSLPLTSPSMINPIYGMRPITPPSSGPSMTAAGGRKGSPRLEAEDFVAPSAFVHQPSSRPLLSANTNGNNGGNGRRISVPPGTGNGAEKDGKHYDSNRHATTYSLGTHSLLSSRAPLSSRFAKSFDTPTAWLMMYFAFNLGLTLYNKLVLQGFPFPWTLTGIQMLSGTVGTQIALNRGFFVQAKLTTQEGMIMVAFSTLYTINIAVSNLSLHLVTVPFHQVVRAMTPLFTIVLSALFFRKRYSRNTYLSLLPVVAGVVFATYGDYYFTAWGLILTLIGTALAAVKTLVTNKVQVGRLKLHPLDLLIRMSPLAFMQCVLWGWYSGELEKVRVYGATQMTRSKAIALAVNGVIAFGLNVVSFTANKKTSALTMTVAANVKQVLTIILAVMIFNLTLNGTNIFGIILTLFGGAVYGYTEFTEKSKGVAPISTAPSRDDEKRSLG